MEASLLALQVHFHLTKGTAKKLTGRHRVASSRPSRPPGPQHEKKMRLYEDSKHAPVSATATAVGRSGKYAPLFVSSAALTLICKWSPKFYTYVYVQYMPRDWYILKSQWWNSEASFYRTSSPSLHPSCPVLSAECSAGERERHPFASRARRQRKQLLARAGQFILIYSRHKLA